MPQGRSVRAMFGFASIVPAAALALAVVSALAVSSPAGARPSKRRQTKPKVASEQTTTEINRLLGDYKWGMPSAKVMSLMTAEIRKEYQKPIAQEKEPIKQDELRRELREAINKLKSDHVRFEGKPTTWDVSLVDKEFAHKNGEAMLVRWGQRDRKFYFFHNDRLWKIYIAFNADLYRDKTFEDFAGMMERRFGPAERKYKMSLKGEAQMSHLEWPPSGGTALLAIDNTEFYGNFCLVLIDREAAKQVRQGRKVNNPNRRYSDPLIDAVTRDAAKDKESQRTDDVVDRITGRQVSKPTDNDTPGRPTGKTRSQPEKGSKGALEGLDL